MPEVIFTGPAGRLEGRYHPAKQKNAPIAIVLHPHPQFGGTMNHQIVYQLYYAFVHRGFSVLRFNFRGVGRSQGSFDHGTGELSDAASALDWAQTINPEARACWIAGFSFGAWIGMQLLMRRPEIEGFISIAPPANLYDFSFLAPCPSSGLIVHGDKDAVVPPKDVNTLVEKLKTQKGIVIDQQIIPGANHFFDGKIEPLMETVHRLSRQAARQRSSAVRAAGRGAPRSGAPLSRGPSQSSPAPSRPGSAKQRCALHRARGRASRSQLSAAAQGGRRFRRSSRSEGGSVPTTFRCFTCNGRARREDAPLPTLPAEFAALRLRGELQQMRDHDGPGMRAAVRDSQPDRGHRTLGRFASSVRHFRTFGVFANTARSIDLIEHVEIAEDRRKHRIHQAEYSAPAKNGPAPSAASTRANFAAAAFALALEDRGIGGGFETP